MHSLSRRQLLLAGGVLAAGSLLGRQAHAAEPLRVWRYKGMAASFMADADQADTPYPVEWVDVSGGNLVLEALSSGHLDYAFMSEIPPIFASIAKVPIALVALFQGDQNDTSLVVKKDSGLRTVQDLKGKTISYVRATNTHYFVLNMLAQNGLSLADVKAVVLPHQQVVLGEGFDKGLGDDLAVLFQRTAGRAQGVAREDHLVIEERAGLGGDRVKQAAQRRPHSTVEAVQVGNADHFRTRLLQVVVQFQGAGVEQAFAFDDLAVAVHTQQVRDGDLRERYAQWVDPVVVRVHRVAGGEVPCHADFVAQAAEQAVGGGEFLLAVYAFLQGVVQLGHCAQGQAVVVVGQGVDGLGEQCGMAHTVTLIIFFGRANPWLGLAGGGNARTVWRRGKRSGCHDQGAPRSWVGSVLTSTMRGVGSSVLSLY